MALLQICFDDAFRTVLAQKIGLYELQEVHQKRRTVTTLSQGLLETKRLGDLLVEPPLLKDEAEAAELLTLARIADPTPPAVETAQKDIERT